MEMPMNSSSMQANDKKVLIFGSVDMITFQGIDTQIIALGHTSEQYPLNSLVEVEEIIKQLRISGELLAVLLFLDESAIIDYCGLEYLEVWQNLFSEMKRTTSLIFVENNVLQGTFPQLKIDLTFRKRSNVENFHFKSYGKSKDE